MDRSQWQKKVRNGAEYRECAALSAIAALVLDLTETMVLFALTGLELNSTTKRTIRRDAIDILCNASLARHQ